MKRKGFTLMELLGVIIIISVIALITVPIVMGIIEGSRREAFRDSVYGAFHQLEYYKIENNIGSIPAGGVDIHQIGLKEGSFEYGTFRLDGNGEEKAINVSDGRYCAVGILTDLKVYKGGCDLTVPTCELEVKGIKGVGGWSSKNLTITMTTSKASTGGLVYGIGIQEDYSKSVENGKIGKGEYEATEAGRVYCYVQNIGEEKGTNSVEVKIDKTEPSKADFTYQATSNSITITAIGEDKESGIVRYQFSKDDGKTWSEIQSERSYTYKGLTTGEYKIKVRVYNGTYEESEKENNLRKESETKVVKTKELNAPTYEVSTNKWTNQNVKVTVKYEGEGVRLFQTTVGVTSNITAVKCSRVYNGEYECNGESTKNIEAGRWYKVEGNVELTFEENGSVIAQVVDGVNYKTGSSLTVGNIDKTNPNITISTSGVRTDRTTVVAACSDGESGITKYEYSKDNGATWVNGGVASSYTFIGLTKGTNYIYKVRCTNGAGGTSETSHGATTGEMINPTMMQISQTPASGAWATSRVIQITYNNANVENPSYYFKSTVGVTVESGVVTGICGTGTNPGECTSSNVTTIVANTWYRTNSTMPSITYRANGVLYAVLGDGTNLSGTATISVSNIDTTAPSVPKVTYLSGANTCVWKNNNNIQVVSSDNVGIAYYQIDGNGDGIPDTNLDINTAHNGWIPGNWHSCIARFRAVDHAGNISEWTEHYHIHQDVTAPSVPNVIYNGGANTCTWQNNYNITLSASDNVEIAYYEIDVDNNGTADGTTGANFIPPNGFSTCTWRARAVDHAGNRSGWTGVHHIHMDTENPTHTNWWWGEVTKDVARLYIQATDNVGIGRVQCRTSTATGGYNNWNWFEGVWDASANAYRCDITPGTFGHYNQTYTTHLYLYDHAGNGGFYNQTSVAIPAVCATPSVGLSTTGGRSITIVTTNATEYTVINPLDVGGSTGWLSLGTNGRAYFTAIAPGTHYIYVRNECNQEAYKTIKIATSAFNYSATVTTYDATYKENKYCSEPGGWCNGYCVSWGEKCDDGSSPNFNVGHDQTCSCGNWVNNGGSYSCPNGGTLSGTKCYIYSCPNGGTLSETTCVY